MPFKFGFVPPKELVFPFIGRLCEEEREMFYNDSLVQFNAEKIDFVEF